MKIIRLTENDLKKVISESAKRILREYTGDEEEYGRYDLEDEPSLPFGDDDNNSLMPNGEDFDKWFDSLPPEEQQEYADDMEADQYIGQEYYDPTDSDLYRYGT